MYQNLIEKFEPNKLKELKEILVEMHSHDIAELLENYNISVENYSEECEHWFEKVVSPETKETRMVYPAIVKDGQAVLKGKVFVCE